ncbi:MAG TPA: rod shape-determining protein MreC [Telluria sp.]|nr:rod shape-determining protein MreC [Telluria sp.]
MEYSPPPLFKQGAPARVKVTFFALLSVALLMADSRLHALAVVRQVAGTVLYPLQMAALWPRDALVSVGNYFTSLSELQKEVRDLKRQQLVAAQVLQQAQMEVSENAQLRRLMGAKEHVPVKSLMSEILYDARDPASRKIVLDRGARDSVVLGLPVVDGSGVVGQVTRVFPFTSEVTLLTDKEQAIPVQVLRSGLRSVAYGRGQSGQLDLRFVAPNADIQIGDILITSGLDGVYPAGLAVAKVVQVESAAGAFGRVICQPLAGVDRYRQLLVLLEQPPLAPRPGPAAEEDAKSAKGKSLPKMAPLTAPPPSTVPDAASRTPLLPPAALAPAPQPSMPSATGAQPSPNKPQTATQPPAGAATPAPKPQAGVQPPGAVAQAPLTKPQTAAQSPANRAPARPAPAAPAKGPGQ